MAGSTEFTVNIRIKSKDTSGPETKKAVSGLDKLKKAATLAAAGFAALKSAQAVVELAKFGAAVGRQAKSLDALAKSAGTSGKEIVASIQGAADFTIDRMSAMESANKAMLLEVAKTPAEFERMTKVAVGLGRVMGQDAAKSLDDMTTAAGRQSIQIADNLGLIIRQSDLQGEVNRLMKENPALTEAAAKKQAFLNQMLAAGEEKLAALGDVGLDTAGKFEKVDAALSDLKSTGATAFLSLIEGSTVLSTALDELPGDIRTFGQAIDNVVGPIGKVNDIMTTIGQWTPPILLWRGIKSVFTGAATAIADANKEFSTFRPEIERYAHTIKASNPEIERYANGHSRVGTAVVDYTKNLKFLMVGIDQSAKSFDQYTTAIESASEAQEAGITITERMAIEQRGLAKEQAILAQKTKEAAFDSALTLTSFYQNRTKQATQNVKTIKDIEAEHADNLLEIQKQGQSKAIQFNEVAEKKKLETLQSNLNLALLQQSEFTDKTKESTRVRKEQQIAAIQERVAAQAALLDDYYAGRLVVQGKNITEDLAAEQTRYDSALTLAKEQQALQEEEQRKSLGRMLLQQLETWATINKVAGTELQIMKDKIALEYGLMTQHTKTQSDLQLLILDEWKKDTSKTYEEAAASIGIVISKAGLLTQTLEKIPLSKRIDIEINVRRTGYGGSLAEAGVDSVEAEAARVDTRGAGGVGVGSTAGGAGDPNARGYQHGGSMSVRQGSPDRIPMRVAAGERVTVQPRVSNDNRQYNLNVSPLPSSNVAADFQMMQELAA